MASKRSSGPNKTEPKRSAAVESSADLYELNSRIVALLQQDGRMPYSTIASALGVSEGTVRNRVRQLIDDNVITIQAEALPEAFGYDFNAMTFIQVAAGADIDALIARLHAVPEVFYLISMLGRFNIGAATYHKSHEDYRTFLTTHCFGHADIAAIETSMVLEVHKMKLQWHLEDGRPAPAPARKSRKD